MKSVILDTSLIPIRILRFHLRHDNVLEGEEEGDVRHDRPHPEGPYYSLRVFDPALGAARGINNLPKEVRVGNLLLGDRKGISPFLYHHAHLEIDASAEIAEESQGLQDFLSIDEFVVQIEGDCTRILERYRWYKDQGRRS